VKDGLYTYLPLERVVFGKPAAQAVLEEAQRLGAQRVFIVASRTLVSKTPLVGEIEASLGTRHAGTFDGCVAHTPWPSVVEASAAVRDAAPDLIVTVGGGTAIDTVKILQLCLAHGITRPEDMERVSAANLKEPRPSLVRQIVVPTTLSGAEFSNLAGGTDPRTRLKHSFSGPDIGARAVILDPAATRYTPEWLWLSTGVRGVDHAVEALCSVQANPYCDGLALHALRVFAEALPRSRAEPENLQTRLACQQASWLAASTIARVSYGASHGIGHALGAAADVPHGHTSCVMLPHVMRYNEAFTGDKQKLVAAALGKPALSGADAVAELIAALGQPATLRAVNVKREHLPKVVEGALKNSWVRVNPRPIRSGGDVMQILEAAW
jgi:alcohol dehydrogenase class IV